jgi:hypothetical protein
MPGLMRKEPNDESVIYFLDIVYAYVVYRCLGRGNELMGYILSKATYWRTWYISLYRCIQAIHMVCESIYNMMQPLDIYNQNIKY